MRILSRGVVVPIVGSLVLLLFFITEDARAVAATAMGVQAVATQKSPGGLSQPRPVSLAHLYRHFLVYVHTLDTAAAKITAQGKDGSPLRNDLQRRLKFSDADFAPIRASSQRLASELAGIKTQANAIQSAGLSASNRAQLKALMAQREGYINNEITSLQQALTPEKRASLEAFMTQFFAPKTVTYHTPSSTRPQSGKAGL